jgi:hypothetical protein
LDKVKTMAHYAFLDENNVVTEVIVGKDETNFDWEQQYGMFRGQACKRTSYNTHGGIHYTDGLPSEDQSKAFRKNYAGIGFFYDSQKDAFIPPKPFESWILDEFSCLWKAPILMPTEGGPWSWDEQLQSWIEFTV